MRVLSAGSMVLVALALGACASAPGRIDAFTASPGTAKPGEEVTLAWTLAGDIASLAIDQDGVALAPAPEAAATGSRKVTGLAPGTHRFVLRATDVGGVALHASASVEVLPPVQVTELTAAPTQVRAGQPAAISWRTAGAASAQLFRGDTLLETVDPRDVADGSTTIRPTMSADYRLVATGPGGSDEKTVRIDVPGAPLFLSLDVAPARIKAGGTATMSWKTSGATMLEVRAGATVVHQSLEDAGEGHVDLTATATTTYDVVAKGPGGEALEHRTVTVLPPARIVSFAAQPADIVVGGTSTLAWFTEGVESIALTANGTPVDVAALDPAAGTLDVSPKQDTVYELTGTGPDGTASASTMVAVGGTPVIDSFQSDTAQVILGETTAALSWRTHNGTTLLVEDDEGMAVDVSGQQIDAGTVVIAPVKAHTYVLTLIGPGGIVQSPPVSVGVVVPAPKATLRLAQATVIEGKTTTISWAVTGQTTMGITASTNGGTPKKIDLSGHITTPGSAHDDMTLPVPLGDMVYELTATGPGGVTKVQASLTLIRKPAFTNFTSDKRVPGTDEVRVTRGRKYQLTWETTSSDWTHMLPRRIASDSPPFVSIVDRPDAVPVPMAGDPRNPYAQVAFPGNFQFPFYGTTQTTARLESDGYLCFGGDNVCGYGGSIGGHDRIPSSLTRPDAYIAPFHADLQPTADTRHAMWLDVAASPRRLVFEWNATDFKSSFAAGSPLTFQAVLSEDGDWELWNAPRTGAEANAASTERWGTTAVLGIEAPGGTDGIQVAYDTTAALCSDFTPPQLPQPGRCTPITRWRPEKLAASGTESFVADNGKILRMRAFGPAGSTDGPTLTLVTYDEPLINSFAADRPLIAAGESALLSWTTGGDNATRVLAGGAAPANVGANASLRVNPTQTTTYTLTVTNRAGDSISKTVTVRVEAPDVTFGVRNVSAAVPSATATPTATGAAGDRFELSWQAISATALTLTEPSGAVVSLPVPTDGTHVAAGTLERVVTQSGTYTLQATNASGSRTVTATVTVTGTVAVLSFTASRTRQTAGEPVSLSWETWNAKTVDVRVAGDTSPACATAGSERVGTCTVAEGAARTTWILTARDAAGNPVTASVAVDAVPRPTGTLNVSPMTVPWNGTVSLDWAVQGATRQRLYRRTSSDTPPGLEIGAARTAASGSLTIALQRDTTFELVAENELGFTTSVVRGPVDVQLGALTANLASKFTTVPRGGVTTLTWNTPGSAKTTFWQRDPPDAPAYSSVGDYADEVTIPIEPFDDSFVDITATGDVVKLMRGPNEDFATGYAIRDLPEDFTPEYLGVPVGRVLVSASGVLMFGTRGGPDSEFDLCALADCSGQNVIQSDGTGTAKQLVLAAWWGRLTARYGCAGPLNCHATTPPGQVYWKLLGTAPNRRLVVQWDRWDARDSYAVGEFTFEAVLRENGDSELHYKTLRSASLYTERGCDVAAGAERRPGLGPYRDYYATVNSRHCLLDEGDGFLIRSGVQPPSGSLVARIPQFRSTSPRQLTWKFRVTAENPETTPVRATASASVAQIAGISELTIEELMLSPPAGESQWIEVHNAGVITDVPLAGWSIITPTGTYPLTGGSVPASPVFVAQANEGRAVIGADANLATNGHVSMATTWPANVHLSESEGFVALAHGDTIVDVVDYGPRWPLPTGRSVSFDTLASDRNAKHDDDPFFWCATNDAAGDRSTPGLANPPCHTMEPIDWDPSLDIENDAQATYVNPASGKVEVSLPFSFAHFGYVLPGPFTFANGGAVVPHHIDAYWPPANAALPSNDFAANGLYPYWDELTYTTSSRMLWRILGSAPNRIAVFEWVGFKPSKAAGDLTFLVAIRENGPFEFQYKRLGEATGSTATIGFEALFNELGVTYGYNAPVLPPPGRSPPFGLRYRHLP